MTNYINYSEKERLEALYQETQHKKTKFSKFFSILTTICQSAIATLTRPQEPKIWQSTDRYGHRVWHGYDPVKDCLVCRDSEQEMRIWLEERYYQ